MSQFIFPINAKDNCVCDGNGGLIARAARPREAQCIAKALNHIESLHRLARHADRLLAAIDKKHPGVYKSMKKQWDDYDELKAFS